MTDIVLLTRNPNIAPNRPNWIIASQETNAKGAEWRTIAWGKGTFNLKGFSSAEVENALDSYILNRKGTGYVEQARLKVYASTEQIASFIAMNLPKVMSFVDGILGNVSDDVSDDVSDEPIDPTPFANNPFDNVVSEINDLMRGFVNKK